MYLRLECMEEDLECMECERTQFENWSYLFSHVVL